METKKGLSVMESPFSETVTRMGSQTKLSNRLHISYLFYCCKDSDNFFISQTFCDLFLIFIHFKNKKIAIYD